MKEHDIFKTVAKYTYEIILENDKWKGRYIHNNVIFYPIDTIVKYSKYVGNRLENPKLLENK